MAPNEMHSPPYPDTPTTPSPHQDDYPSGGPTVSRPPTLTISSLYSTAQCILSMVGSIGVILLFAGIPQLIYSPSVQLSNLMTFLLGASLIIAMVGGNAFVNYKYRQYLHARNQAVLQSRRLSRQRRDEADKPPNYDDLDTIPPMDAAVLEQKPPRYEDVVNMYNWGGAPKGISVPTGGCSLRSSPSCGSFDNPDQFFGTNSNTSQDCSEVVKSPGGGVVNPAFDIGNAFDEASERKLSTTSFGSLGEARNAITVPVHKMLNRFKRSKSYSTESPVDGPKTSSAKSVETSKFSEFRRLSRVFNRSTSEDGFQSLPPSGVANNAVNYVTDPHSSSSEEHEGRSLPSDISRRNRVSSRENLSPSSNSSNGSPDSSSSQSSASSSNFYLSLETKDSQLAETHHRKLHTGKNFEVRVDIEFNPSSFDNLQSESHDFIRNEGSSSRDSRNSSSSQNSKDETPEKPNLDFREVSGSDIL